MITSQRLTRWAKKSNFSNSTRDKCLLFPKTDYGPACKDMAQTRYKLQNYDLLPPMVTLTFDIDSWILCATHLHIIVNIFKKYHEDNNMTWTRYKLQNVEVWPLSVTLTFDIVMHHVDNTAWWTFPQSFMKIQQLINYKFFTFHLEVWPYFDSHGSCSWHAYTTWWTFPQSFIKIQQ